MQEQDLAASDGARVYELIKNDSIEMGRLKSDLDISQFTVNSVGPFPAHQFHFLMRQYSIAALELWRMENDRNRLQKTIDAYSGMRDRPEDGWFRDNAVVDLQIQIETLELSIRNKRGMCEKFEEVRQLLIKQNGKEFLDKQFQDEEPKYWEWFFTSMLARLQRQQVTGVPEHVQKSIEQYVSDPILPLELPVLPPAPLQLK